MTLNPFIELGRNPISAFAMLGYLLFLLTFVILSTGYCLRTAGNLYVRYKHNGHTKQWWSGPLDVGIVPPASWSARAATIPLVFAFTAWAIGGIIWIVAP